jgi:RNA polymerase sigma factor (sigma-70 family)
MAKTLVSNEEQLLRGIKENDPAILKYIYKAYYPSVFYFITNNNGSDEEAKDIYQEAVIILYENLQEEEFTLSCKVQTYIYSVCRKLWLKSLLNKNRFRGRLDDIEEFIPLEGLDEELEEKEERLRSMKESMLLLGEPCRTLLENFYMEGLSMQEISERFGYTNADNAKNQKYKCLLRLKKIFFENYNKRL